MKYGFNRFTDQCILVCLHFTQHNFKGIKLSKSKSAVRMVACIVGKLVQWCPRDFCVFVSCCRSCMEDSCEDWTCLGLYFVVFTLACSPTAEVNTKLLFTFFTHLPGCAPSSGRFTQQTSASPSPKSKWQQSFVSRFSSSHFHFLIQSQHSKLN